MKKGFVLLEILLSVLLLGIIVTAIVGALIYGQETTARSGDIGRAVALADEGLEAVRNIRDAGFVNLVDGTYGLAVTGGIWVFSGSQDVTGIFTRRIIISTYGPQRKQIISRVTIDDQEKEVILTTILSNWRRPAGGGPSI